MTNALPEPVHADRTFPRPVRYMFWGGIVGLVLAIVATFVVSVLWGRAQGMSPGDCAIFGCTLTLLLSQFAGFSGMFAGAGIGAVTGGLVYVAHDKVRARRA